MSKTPFPFHVAIMLHRIKAIPSELIRARIKEAAEFCFARGINQISFFQREVPKSELMKDWIMTGTLVNVELRILEKGSLPPAKGEGGIINLGFNYSEKEILLNILRAKKNPPLEEKDIQQYFFERKWFEPDLVIITAGARYLGDCLTWSAAYSELFFCSLAWLDFKREDLLAALSDYEGRKRRFGRIEPA